MEEKSKIIQEETETLLKKAGIDATVEVKVADEVFNVHIDASENALLIGKHGNTLSSLELVMSLIVAKKLGEFQRIILEVGGYREAREDYLIDLAERLREEVLATGSEKQVRGLRPWERRIIHMHLGENEDVATESEGEERDRVLVIKKK
ncbi:MAG: KH domain-containing protein [Candidatus Levybacteria bacterium]|nr:KH domain-containing protein [Candidatus Levybacteria bacterium]